MPTTAAETEPEIKDLSKLRDHQKKKMKQWFRKGTFWLALRTALDKAPILLIGKENHQIKEEYKRIGKARRSQEVFSGTFKTDKAKKQYEFTCDTSPKDLNALGDLLFSVAGKGVESFLWNGQPLQLSSQPPTPEQLKALVKELSDKARSIDDQIELDVQAWQGVLRYPGDSELKKLVSRLFTLLVHGGLLYRTTNTGTWRSWAGGMPEFPVASVLSHGGRVMIQLPAGEAGKTAFKWLVPAKFRNLTRPFASHGLSSLDEPVTVLRRTKYFVEKKGLSTARHELLKNSKHLGINVPLFGHGKINPHSRRLISANGEHGHLYIYYRPSGDDKPGGLLVGCEGSEAGKSDQYGHKHDARAISAPISPTSGQKWRLVGEGPGSRGDADDTLFLDLSETFEEVKAKSTVRDAATSVR